MGTESLTPEQTVFISKVVVAVVSGSMPKVEALFGQDVDLTRACANAIMTHLVRHRGSMGSSKVDHVNLAAQKILAGLGVDLMPSYLSLVYGRFAENDRELLLQPAVIAERILKAKKGELDIFLTALDHSALLKCSKPQMAFKRLHMLTGDNALLVHTSNAYKASILEDDLGL